MSYMWLFFRQPVSCSCPGMLSSLCVFWKFLFLGPSRQGDTMSNISGGLFPFAKKKKKKKNFRDQQTHALYDCLLVCTLCVWVSMAIYCCCSTSFKWVAPTQLLLSPRLHQLCPFTKQTFIFLHYYFLGDNESVNPLAK